MRDKTGWLVFTIVTALLFAAWLWLWFNYLVSVAQRAGVRVLLGW